MTDAEQAKQLQAIVSELHPVVQLIVMAGVAALARREIDFATYEAWVNDRVDRYWAGEEFHLPELVTPPRLNG